MPLPSPKLPDPNAHLDDYAYIKTALHFALGVCLVFHQQGQAQMLNEALKRLARLNKTANGWASAYPRDERKTDEHSPSR